MKKNKKISWFILSFIFFGFFRLVNLNLIPVFADEAIYIHWAQLAWHDHTKRFISLTDGKPPLHTWLMIPFLKIIKDPLIAGRLLSITAGLAVMVGIFLIVKKLFGKKMAVIAAVLTAICPFLVFYDRLAVADSLLTAFGVWSFYLSLLLSEKPDLGKAFLLGFCWGGGLLTKPPGLYFIVLSPLIFLLTIRFPPRLRWKRYIYNLFKLLKNRFIYWFLAILIAVLSYNVIKLSPFSHLISARSYDYILGKREWLKDPFQLFWGNLRAIIFWVASYQTKAGSLLFLLGLALLFKRNWKKAGIFFIWLLAPILWSAAIGKIIFPRYFVLIQPWIIIFIAYGLNSLLNRIDIKFKLSPITHYCLFIVLILPWLIFSWLIVFKPARAPLIKREQDQYLTSWSAGYGLKEVALWLKEKHTQEKAYVATEGYFGTLPDGLQIYLDGFGNIEVYGIGQPISHIPEKTLNRAKDFPTYLVVNDTRYLGQGEHLELIKSFPKPEFPFLKESLLLFKVKEE